MPSSHALLYFGLTRVRTWEKDDRHGDLPGPCYEFDSDEMRDKDTLRAAIMKHLPIGQDTPIVEFLGYTKLHGETRAYQQANYNQSVKIALEQLAPILKEASGGAFIAMTSASTGKGVDNALKEHVLSGQETLPGSDLPPLLMVTSYAYPSSAQVDRLPAEPEKIRNSYLQQPKFWTQVDDFLSVTSKLADIIVVQGGGGLSMGEIIEKSKLNKGGKVVVIEDENNPVYPLDLADKEGEQFRIMNASRLLSKLMAGRFTPQDIPPHVSREELEQLKKWLTEEKHGIVLKIPKRQRLITKPDIDRLKKFLEA